jgi:macrolide transport system ATP-binding/permease protein
MIHYLRALAARLRGLFGDRRANQELDDEIETHMRLLAERYVRQGMSEAGAAWASRRQFGNVTLLKEEHRDMRAIRLIETFIQDLRYGARTLLRTPGFTLIIVITLALGIGVNTVILSTVNGFLLRGLAVEKPAELISAFWGKKSDPQVWDIFSYPNYIDVRNRTQSFSGLAAWNNMYSASLSTTDSRNAGGQERAELIWGERVSGNYFEVMGV